MKDENHIKELLKAERALLPEEEELLEEWYGRFEIYPDLTFDSTGHKNRVKADMKVAIWQAIDAGKTGAPVPARMPFWRSSRAIGVAASLLLAIAVVAFWVLNRPGSSDQLQLVEVKAAQGTGTAIVYLPDSSKVYLMAGAVLKYPKKFDPERRMVKLTRGNAFFEVRHNPGAPFTVATEKGINTTVLGTSFMVATYDNIKVTLLSGKVKVAQATRDLATLNPNQQLSYNVQAQTSSVEETDAAKLCSWVKGSWVMEHASAKEVFGVIENVFGVSVHYNPGKFDKKYFNFEFTDETSLTEVLDIVKDLSAAEYTLNNKEVRFQ